MTVQPAAAPPAEIRTETTPAASKQNDSARTIIDMDGQMAAQQLSALGAQQQAARATSEPVAFQSGDAGPNDMQAYMPPPRAVEHTPPAGMPPGHAPGFGVPTPDPEAATMPPETAEAPAARSVSPHDRTIGPGAAVSPPSVEEEPEQLLARLVSVRRDGTDGDSHEIREESFDLGRTEGQLSFSEDPYLSPRHCRLFLRDGKWVLQDLGSVNGVFVRFTRPRPLVDGDHLLLGKQVLRFGQLGDKETQMSPAVQHGVMVFGSPLRQPWGRLQQLSVAGNYRDVYHLYRPQVTFGRDDGDFTFPDDEFMSRKHMAVSFIDGKALVQDLGSSNGTFMRVDGEIELTPADMLRLGDQLLRFELA